MDILQSKDDASVNFTSCSSDGGMWESRYVRRVEDRFIAYLSSHTGCTQACRFCHLTATGQTTFTNATIEDYYTQALPVMEHYDTVSEANPRANRVNFNFMARGEPLANPTVVHGLSDIVAALDPLALMRGLKPKYNVSSIMPQALSGYRLENILAPESSMLYYSLYSLRPEFRRRWLPKAMDPYKALDMIKDYQSGTDRLITLHWAFIKDANDDLDTIHEILDAVHERDIKAKFNLVRYNPYSSHQGEEPSDEILQRNFDVIKTALGHPSSRIVPRVGFDVKASCGMFVNGPGAKSALVSRAGQ